MNKKSIEIYMFVELWAVDTVIVSCQLLMHELQGPELLHQFNVAKVKVLHRVKAIQAIRVLLRQAQEFLRRHGDRLRRWVIPESVEKQKMFVKSKP
jgi:hypothetical protein